MEETRSFRFIPWCALFITLILLASVFVPIEIAGPATASTSGDYDYELINGDTEVKLTKYHGPGGDVIIPAEIDGRPVVSIDYRTFDDMDDLTSVTLPVDVYNVNPSSFWNCPNLTALHVNESNTHYESVGGVLFSESLALLWIFPLGLAGPYIVPDTTTTIGYEAFAYCSGLTSITVPDSVTTINQKAFYSCASLTNATLGSGISSIADSTFGSCRSLSSITIPDSVTAIGNRAFMSCSSLTQVTIGSGVSSIGIMAFDACSSLTTIDIPGNVHTIGAYAFMDCGSLSSLTLNEGVTTIADRAFLNCDGLTTVTIPGSVTSLNDNVFNSCGSMTAIEVHPANTAYESAGGVLYSEDLTKLIKYPCGMASSYNVPETVTSLGESAFTSSPYLTAVRIGKNLTDIPMWALSYCASLSTIDVDGDNPSFASMGGVLYDKEVTEMLQYPSGRSGPFIMPSSVTSLRDWCMAFAQNLTALVIPEGVTYVGDGAVSESPSLQTVSVPASAEHVGDWNFMDCPALTAIEVNAGNPNYSSVDGVLLGENGTVLIIYPEAKAGDYVIPDGVEIIQEYAFDSCFLLTSITVPESVTLIQNNALVHLTDLEFMLFQGDAPTCEDNWYWLMNESLVVYYYKGAAGFTTPTWSGLDTVSLSTPCSPVLVSATPEGTSIELVWTVPEDDGNLTITGFKVYFGTVTPDQQFNTMLPNGTTSLSVTGLEEGTKYFFAVTAVNELGESDPSNVLNATTEESSDLLEGSTQGLLIVVVVVVVAVAAAVAVWWFRFRR